ncbi:MAG: pyruvate carboxylase [Corynebacterium sp.]|nr:pyruvate carboxylase [Corynebacterium sp.]
MAESSLPSFNKVLVANRGEIAVRAFRAAYETGAKTVAIYPREDRNSFHRAFADEAVRIGTEGQPVKAYLDINEVIRAAKKSGADAIYPGYGFLSERADLARACVENGIKFIGPTPETLELTGDKAAAVEAAEAAGLPTLKDSKASTDPDELLEFSKDFQYPIFVKAVAGGGGRGMRFIESEDVFKDRVMEASREAEAAFGDGSVYLETAVIKPQHIEVQILADSQGNVMHLFERDCSVQRRHQKVVEIAPAPFLDKDLRDRICADAVRFCEHINYEGAGTVEFLVDERGNHVFIEMNPRVQVEHTVTEEVTGVDIVKSQMLIAAGASLEDLGLSQEKVAINGFALQCRITTEDPTNDFRPDTGTLTSYRSPGGAGVRLDGATSVGAEISPNFDSLLVKMTCRGKDFQQAVQRASRALKEFKVAGVATNIGYLRALLREPDFTDKRIDTGFITDHPHLLQAPSASTEQDRIIEYLADVTVNRPNGKRPTSLRPFDKLPKLDRDNGELPRGSRDELLELGPVGFAKKLREQSALAITDTTFRDAHQSLLATRVRGTALITAAEHVARQTPQLYSVEAWGGATFDVAMRFLHEDPWQRLDLLREAVPNINIQMLLRGRNTVGYTPYPNSVCRAFVQEAAKSGVDVFRIFDALNDVSQMAPAIEAVLETNTTIAEVAMAYSGDMCSPNEKLYTLDYYLKLAETIVKSGAHVLAIKDMAGLLRPESASKLVTELRKNFDLPVHVHTHDTAGGQLATYYAAALAGADAVDGASAPLAGTTSQPSLSAIVAAFSNSSRDTGLDLDAICSLEPYWEAVRQLYAPFENGIPGPTGRVYTHEIPGGQLSNLRAQASALGLADRFEVIENNYAAVNEMLGRPTKVTPSSKVVGDLALHLVGAGVDPAEFEENPTKYDIPDSVIAFLRGELGTPPGGWPPLRDKILSGHPGELKLTEIPAEEESKLESDDSDVRRSALNRLLFPKQFEQFNEFRRRFGNTEALNDAEFFYGLTEGEERIVHFFPEDSTENHRSNLNHMVVRLDAVGEPDEKGMRLVIMNVNGQIRPLKVRDNTVESTTVTAEKAEAGNDSHVAAPFAGVVNPVVEPGDEVKAGDPVAVIEAMKMEASISATKDGVIERVAIGKATTVEGGDLIAVIK